MRTNKAVAYSAPTTHEGAVAPRINAEQELRRSIAACLLWEDNFYESGQAHADRVRSLVAQCRPEFAAAVAFEARTKMKLRHAPLLVVREMARLPEHKRLVGKLLCDVIQRPDELAEFLSIYWREGRQPLSAQVKKGLAAAFNKFDEYAFAKYDRAGAVKLRDALFLCHSNPTAKGSMRYTKAERKLNVPRTLNDRELLFKKLVDGQLATPDTWEVALSGGADKRATFERLMEERKLGALAFLRNLRNMEEANVSKMTVENYAAGLDVARVLPFRFISAARAVPKWEPMLEGLMLKALASAEKLAGKTAVVVDNSGSMYGAKVSAKSEIDRSDAACALAILFREICEQVVVIGFATEAKVIAPRQGFALADAIKRGPVGGTSTSVALNLAEKEGYDRIVVVTDEQSHTRISAPKSEKAYFINVATYQNGIGYGNGWTHIDGWSEAVVEYIREIERGSAAAA